MNDRGLQPVTLADTTSETPFEALEQAARARPEAEFLHVPASATRAYAPAAISLTYGAALAQVEALALRYAKARIGPGMRVALLLENRPAFFLHWFALNAVGACVVPVNPDYRESELAYLLSHSEAVLAVGLTERLAALRAAAALGPGTPVVDADSVAGGLSGLALPVAQAAARGRAAECALMYTSGTTGRPKGCLLGNEYFLCMGLRYLNRRGYVQLEPGRSRVLTPLPMFHMNAMAGSTMGMVMSGGCVIQLDRFHPRSWWRDVTETRATGIHCLGVMPAILLGLPPAPEETAHQVRYGTAANVEPQHHAAFEARFGFPLIEGWAMTETGAGAAIAADTEPRHPGTRCFGRCPPEVEMRLVDETGAEVAEGEPGEMLVRHAGPDPRLGFFSGYLKDEAATAAGWAGGWWHTGDVVRRWPDGTLHFVDRRKNVIRRSGENISALEVEAALRGHPRVAQVAVTGVADEIRGEEVMACIVAAGDGDAAAARDIQAWALAQLAYYKCPGWIVFVPGLPTTATQKLQRGALREFAEGARGGEACFDLRACKQRVKQPSGEEA